MLKDRGVFPGSLLLLTTGSELEPIRRGEDEPGMGIIETDQAMSRCDAVRSYFQMVFGGLLEEAQAAGQVAAEEVTRFWNELAQADREQRLFGYVGFVVGGRKP